MDLFSIQSTNNCLYVCCAYLGHQKTAVFLLRVKRPPSAVAQRKPAAVRPRCFPQSTKTSILATAEFEAEHAHIQNKHACGCCKYSMGTQTRARTLTHTQTSMRCAHRCGHTHKTCVRSTDTHTTHPRYTQTKKNKGHTSRVARAGVREWERHVQQCDVGLGRRGLGWNSGP